MAKKDAKTKAAEKKARTAAKQTKKADKKDKKTKNRARGADEDSDAEEEDLETMLQEYAQQQAQFLKITEVSCEAPTARASATIVASPANSNELFLFGGEHFDGATARFYNDLYVYARNRTDWRRITSPNSPLPRSGHAWTRGGNAGGIYLFGGEFSSPKQGTFYHYNDFWHLDPAAREWTRIEGKGPSPPARSGHRMTYFKNYVVLFGGFQDTSQQTKYLQDLWLYDTQRYLWFQPSLPPASQKPDARSSFSLLPHESGAVLYGGYSRVKSTSSVKTRGKGQAQVTKAVLKPLIHQDTWFLRIQPAAADAPAHVPPVVRWERRKRPANAPNPPRAGATMTFHKTRGIMFGGVHDVEESEEGIDSEFFDTMFAWNIDRNRFFPLTLRRPRNTGKKTVQTDKNTRRQRGKADEEELLRNLASLEARTTQHSLTSPHQSSMEDQEIDPAEAEDQESNQEILFQMPHSRFNAQLTVLDDTLYIYGGTYEHGDREFTFDDLYAVDLVKLDGVWTIFRREVENWNGSNADESDSSEDDEEEDDSDAEDGDTKMVDAATEIPASLAPSADSLVVDNEGTTPIAPSQSEKETLVGGEDNSANAMSDDSRPFPRPFESLRDFFARTTVAWQVYLKGEQMENTHNEDSIKEFRKRAFAAAENRWWDCREEITALEDAQEEAGIGEVISTATRGDAGAGHRR